ncbi:MAG: hypothetical protein J6C28_02815 [Bacilli bacterium]|nr:hypothetical protein [Bacilli bacterium]
MKRTIIYICFVSIITLLCCLFSEEIVTLYYDTIKYFSSENNKLIRNEYFREDNFLYVQNTVNYEPRNEQDITNLFYTIINSGQDKFTFYCSREYHNCLNDIKALATDQTKLSHINNYVHPYNGFKHIEIQYTSSGQVDVLVTRSYSEDEIKVINEKVENIYSRVINENSNVIDKIKAVHDYIINNSKYDSGRSDYNMTTYKSDLAYGPLLQGYGICGGYSDAMALFLEKMGITNYKVSSDTHVWNAVLLDGKWYHLDLTWDDPVTSNKKDILQHEYFILTTDELLSKEVKEHKFDRDIYLEFKTQ